MRKKFQLADVKVGDRFIQHDFRSYNDGNRKNEIHETKIILEVTKIQGTNAEWKLEEVLVNINPPILGYRNRNFEWWWIFNHCRCIQME